MQDDKPKSIIEQAKKRFKACVEAEREQRARELDDLEFLDGEPEAQWGAKAHRERAMSGRPALVINRAEAFVQHVANTQRQNRVAAKVFPVDDGGDPETAEVIQGLLRHIEYTSKADIAYDTAEFFAVAMGRGYWRYIAEYCDPMSFDQELKVVRGSNPFQYYLGPHELPDGSDAKYGFIVTWYTKDEYESEHGESEDGAKDWDGLEEDKSDWTQDDRRAVIEYYVIDSKKGTLVKLQDGTARLKADLSGSETVLIGKDGEPVERETSIPTVKFYKMNALRVMDQTVFPGEYIPIVKVVGSELNVNGKQIFKGLVRAMKDAQRQYNFMLSAQTEAIDMDKGPVVMIEGQAEGHENEWRNISRQKVLQVKGKTIDGKPAPMPTRLQANASVAAMTEARALAGDDLKALTSIYDASLGARSNETSGRGIAARQQQSDIANFHFQDNLTRSITHGTRILVGAIPTYYDTPRVVRIIGDDDTHKVVKVNQQLQDGQKSYKLNVGKYDVVCTADRSWATKRQESADKVTDLIKAFPPLMQICPDYLLKSLDIPYAAEMAERAKKTLPPQLQDQEDGQEKIPPQAQQAIAQLTQQNAELSKHLELATHEYETEKQKSDNQMAVEDKKFANAQTLALLDRETQLLKIQATVDQQGAMEVLKAEIQHIHSELDLMRGIKADQHAAELEKDQAEHGSELQMDQAEHGSGLAMQLAQHAVDIQPPEPSA